MRSHLFAGGTTLISGIVESVHRAAMNLRSNEGKQPDGKSVLMCAFPVRSAMAGNVLAQDWRCVPERRAGFPFRFDAHR